MPGKIGLDLSATATTLPAIKGAGVTGQNFLASSFGPTANVSSDPITMDVRGPEGIMHNRDLEQISTPPQAPTLNSLATPNDPAGAVAFLNSIDVQV